MARLLTSDTRLSDAHGAVKRIPHFARARGLRARLVVGSRLDKFHHSVAQEIVFRVYGQHSR